MKSTKDMWLHWTQKKYHEQREWDCDMAVCCFTDVTVHSSKNYHHEHHAEPRRLQVKP